jgi:transposase
MEGTPSNDMNHDDLLKLVLQLQKQLALQAKRIEELEAELNELRKKNPNQRLEDAYSVKAEEKRREDAQQTGTSKKKRQKSRRRRRITTAEKLAMATQEE